jgi:hypothetical protein
LSKFDEDSLSRIILIYEHLAFGFIEEISSEIVQETLQDLYAVSKFYFVQEQIVVLMHTMTIHLLGFICSERKF